MKYIRPLTFLLVLCLTALGQQSVEKGPVPDVAAQAEASKLVAEVYKSDLDAAKTPAQKIAMAKKLVSEGEATKDDPTSRFVLFQTARDLAAQQGDLPTAFEAVARLDAAFEIDALEMKVEVAGVALKAAKAMQVRQPATAILLPLIDEAIASDRYEQAKSLTTATLAAARDGRDSNLSKQMIVKLKEIEEIAVEFENVKKSMAELDAKPTDPNANRIVGEFLCFRKGDWEQGVTMLALSGDEKFKTAAALELEAEPDALKVAEAWWKIADGLEGGTKSEVQVHAGEWYRKALPSLSGLTKARVERMLDGLSPPRAKKTVVSLLQNLDVNAAKAQGQWRLVSGRLSGGMEGEKSTLNFPEVALKDYELATEFSIVKRPDSGFGDIWIMLPGVRKPMLVRTTAETSLTQIGFNISSRGVDPATSATLDGRLPVGKTNKLRVRVSERQTRVEVYLADKRIVETSITEGDVGPAAFGLTLSPGLQVVIATFDVSDAEDRSSSDGAKEAPKKKSPIVGLWTSPGGMGHEFLASGEAKHHHTNGTVDVQGTWEGTGNGTYLARLGANGGFEWRMTLKDGVIYVEKYLRGEFHSKDTLIQVKK